MDPAIRFLDSRGTAVNNACACVAKYAWNATAINCELNCAGLTNTTGKRTSDFTCECLPNFFWSTNQYLCYINCTAINNTIVRIDTFNCRCKANFTWDGANAVCNPNCSRFSNTNLTATQVLGRCICATNYFWNFTSSTCSLNCNIAHTVGAEAINDACVCVTSYSWNPTTLTCDLNCSSINNTTGSAVNGACNCINGYTWTPSNLTCTPPSVCQNPFIYNPLTQSCDLECCNVEFATGALDLTTCQCDRKHKWNNNTFKCDLNCYLIDYILLEGIHSQTACECELGYIWNATSLECQENCTVNRIYDYTRKECCAKCEYIDNAIPHPSICTKCLCVNNTYWVGEGETKCIPCSRDPHANTDPVFYSVDECICQPSFWWDRDSSSCVVKCSEVDKSTGVTQSASFCDCIPGYKWNGTSYLCEYDAAADEIRLPFHSQNTIGKPSHSCVAP